MTFEEVLDQAIAMLQRRGRLTYRTLQLQFQLDEAHLEALKDELIYGQRLAMDEDGRVLVWTGDTGTASAAVAAPAADTGATAARLHAPLSRREDSDLPQRPRRRAQAGHRAVCRPQGLHGTPGRP